MTAANLGAVDLPELPEAMGMTELGRAFTAAQMRDYARAAIAALTPAAGGAGVLAEVGEVDGIGHTLTFPQGYKAFADAVAALPVGTPIFAAPAPPPAATGWIPGYRPSDVGLAKARAVRAAVEAALSAPPPADAVRALVAKLEQPRTLSMFMGAHDMALALVQERAEIARELAALSAAPVGKGKPCVICGEDEPYSGACGSNDPRALCKQPAAAPTPEGADEKLRAAGLIPCHWRGCRKATGAAKADCSGCGGSGWRRKCESADCKEYGCCHGRYCYVPAAEVAALTTTQQEGGRHG